jgi:hypothetical protein
VTSVHVPLAGTGSAAMVTDEKLVRTLKATAKMLTILCIAKPTTVPPGFKMGAALLVSSTEASGVDSFEGNAHHIRGRMGNRRVSTVHVNVRGFAPAHRVVRLADYA